MMLHDAEKLLMDDLYRNPGPLQFEGPGSDSKTISLTVEEKDYIGKIKELQDYLDKVHLTAIIYSLSSFLFDLNPIDIQINSFVFNHPKFSSSSKNLKTLNLTIQST